jgi:methyl-accepting chemotaxis protein
MSDQDPTSSAAEAAVRPAAARAIARERVSLFRGLTGRIVAVGILPMILLAILTAVVNQSNLATHQATQASVDQLREKAQALTTEINEMKREALALLGEFSLLMEVHYGGILGQSVEATQETLERRQRVGDELKKFSAQMLDFRNAIAAVGVTPRAFRTTEEPTKGNPTIQARGYLASLLRLAGTLNPLFEYFSESNDRTVYLIQSQAFSRAARAFVDEEGDRVRAVNATLNRIKLLLDGLTDALLLSQDQMAKTALADAERKLDESNRFSNWAAIGLVLLLLVVTTAYAVNQVARPVSRLTGAMGRIAAGDLDTEVPATDRHDELGAMARAVEVFRGSLIDKRRLEVEQAEAGRRTQDAIARAIRDITADISVTAQQVDGSVHAVATSAHQMSESIKDVSERLRNMAERTRDAVAEAEQTNATVASLAEVARRITGIVQVIQRIAEQINILSLNAAIEAAHAGAAGKGFAVVADHVQKLSEQTEQATGSIEEQVAAIRQTTDDTAAAISSIVKVIQRIDQLAGAVSAAAEEQATTTSDIARSAQAAAQGAQGMSSRITDIHRLADNSGIADGKSKGKGRAEAAE